MEKHNYCDSSTFFEVVTSCFISVSLVSSITHVVVSLFVCKFLSSSIGVSIGTGVSSIRISVTGSDRETGIEIPTKMPPKFKRCPSDSDTIDFMPVDSDTPNFSKNSGKDASIIRRGQIELAASDWDERDEGGF